MRDNTNYRVVKRLLKKCGYESQANLARDLVKTSCYKDKKFRSIRVYLSSIITGRCKLSQNLEKAILKVCDNGEELVNKLKSDYNDNMPSRYKDKALKYELELKLDRIYNKFKGNFRSLDWKNRSDICFDFENYVKSYLTKKEK